jgi:hypothetical protein
LTPHSWTLRPARLLGSTGLACILIGLLYMPIMPWYILGDLREGEITLWGIWSLIGGAAACFGAFLLLSVREKLQQLLLAVAIPGMLTVLLAQVPAFVGWWVYGGAFTLGWSLHPSVGFMIGILLHLGLTALAVLTLISSVMALGHSESPLRASRRQILQALGAVALIILIIVGINAFQNATWVEVTSPLDGAVNVPLDTAVYAQWKGKRGNNLGLQVRYADDPDLYIPGSTGASMQGVSFQPENGFLPNKKVVCTVEAGWRSYTFSFTTAAQ